MSTTPQNFSFDNPFSTESSMGQQSAAPSSLPPDNPFNVPDKSAQATGETTNDSGSTVIVPKDGESFQDTMKRAAAHGKSVTQSDIDKSMATAPQKVAETVAAAPILGAGGAAAITGAAAAIPAVVPHTIEGVKALGEWASKNPVQAYVLFQVMKEFLPGAKKALGIVKDAPTGK